MYDIGKEFKGTHNICVTVDDVKFMLLDLEKHKTIAIDTETSGLDPYKRDICGYVFGYYPNIGYYIPVRHMVNPIEGEELKNVRVLLKTFLETSGQSKVFFNAKFDIKMLRRDGIRVKGPVEDVSLLFPLLTVPTINNSLKLKDISREVLKFKTLGDAALRKAKHGKPEMVEKYGYSFLPFDLVGVYACEDVMMTIQLWEWMKSKMGVK